MSDDCAAVAQPTVSGTTETPKSLHEFKKDSWQAATNASMNGGQMVTLSPPAGDPAGSQQEPAQGSSTAGSDLTGDAEGVWSIDIDQAFQEALAIYPPCGRRKIIISDEGKMYGRNELIARYIKLRCGKTRTRKQVSSHIQVLARKKARDDTATKKKDPVCPPSIASTPEMKAALPEPTPQPPRIPQLPQFAHALPVANYDKEINMFGIPGKVPLLPPSVYQQLWPQFPMGNLDMLNGNFAAFPLASQVKSESEVETAKSVASSHLTLNGFTAYMETSDGQDRVEIVTIPRNVGEIERVPLSEFSEKYPPMLADLMEKGPDDAFFLAKCWANVHFNLGNEENFLFAVDSYYSSQTRFDISVSTKVCSFGSEVVEKVEVYSAEQEDDHFAFRLEKSPMCEYMVKFISELKKLEEHTWMNNVLENFTVLQVVTNKQTEETLMVLCFVFAINTDPEPSCSIFRLTS